MRRGTNGPASKYSQLARTGSAIPPYIQSYQIVTDFDSPATGPTVNFPRLFNRWCHATLH